MRFGHYELLQKLGAGGMGEVYRAHDRDLGRDVALKFLHERFATDRDRLERFSKEAKAASSLNHPNIVTIHEIGNAGGTPFIVMECVQGQTLRELMKGRALPARRILDVAAQTADGLAQAHAAGIVHRDLKPENLMVTPEGLVKVLDFGLAKLRAPVHVAGAPAPDANASSATTTQATGHALLGTVGYMSPEQASGRPVDFRSDQFALGAILYEMATGLRAFKRETPVQTLSAIIESEPEPLATLSPSFPPPARWVIERCLAKEPQDRYASTADLAHELRSVREHLSEIGSGPIVAPPRRSTRWRWRNGLGVLAAALVFVFAVPPVRDGVLGPLDLLPLPSDKRIAVLPFRATGEDDGDRHLCEGLLDYVVARLGQIERFQQTAWVVPAVDVRQSGVVSPGTAHQALGATLVIEGSLHRAESGLVVTAALIDASTHRQLRGATVHATSGQDSLLDLTVDAVTGMLDLEIGPAARAALRSGGTGVAEASSLYAQALGYRPYSQARTALERFDQQRNLERAIELFLRALEQDPRYALAHAGLGEAYWRLFRITRNPEHRALAEQRAGRALEIDPLLAQAWVTLGIIHTGSGRAKDAVQDLRRAIDRDPRSADALRELANAYDRLGNKADAEATYRKAIELRPDYWITYNYLGGYLVRIGRRDDAEAAYTKALSLVPDNARVWSNLGGAYFLQGKVKEAEAAFRKSMELIPTHGAASNLGMCQYQRRNYTAAAREFEQAVKLDDRDYRVWRNLAASYYWAPGERARARDAYARSAALAEAERKVDPENAEILADLADCYAMLGRHDQARAVASEAAKFGNGDVEIAKSLAGTYETIGERAFALNWITKALTLGEPPEAIERAPSFEKLRSDPRYRPLVKSALAARQRAASQP